MYDTFYIAQIDENKEWYQLLLKDSHFCIAALNSLTATLETLGSYVKTYRTRDRLMARMIEMSYPPVVSEATYARREEYYKVHGEDFAQLVHDTIKSAYEEVQQYDREHSKLTQVLRRKSKSVLIAKAEVVDTTHEVPESTFKSPKVLRKPLLLKSRNN